MMRKSASGAFLAGFLIGALVLVLFQRVGQSSVSGVVGDPIMPVGVEVSDRIAALQDEYDQRIAALTTENHTLKAERTALEELVAKSRIDDPRLGTMKSNLPPLASFDEAIKRAASTVKQRGTENLLAAGYSMERIEYLRRRAEELAALFRQAQTDRMNKGLGRADPEKDLGIRYDPDFALKDEIGDAEYERYLTALKRPTSVGVAEVLKGSIADSVGIMLGDEIVTYNNKRVFNWGQLDGLSLPKDTDLAGELVPVTVRRDGEMMQFMVPRGSLGIRQPPPGSR